MVSRVTPRIAIASIYTGIFPIAQDEAGLARDGPHLLSQFSFSSPMVTVRVVAKPSGEAILHTPGQACRVGERETAATLPRIGIAFCLSRTLWWVLHVRFQQG